MGFPCVESTEQRVFRGEFPIDGRELCLGPLQLRQNPEKLELWFSTNCDIPRDGWSSQHDANIEITLWFAQDMTQVGLGDRAECQLLAGLVVEMPQTVAAFPISSLWLSAEDFK